MASHFDLPRARLEAYLLGTLDEDTRAAVREALIRDEELAAELRAIELDLLDDAARIRPTGDRRQPIEELAAAPHNRSSWQLAQALAERDRRLGSRPDVNSARRADGWRRMTFWPMAAGLILAVGLGSYFMTLQTRNASRTPMVAIESSPRPPGHPAPVAPGTPLAADRHDLGPATSATRETAPSQTLPATTKPAADDPAILALYLPSSTLRGARPEVRLAPSIRQMRLELEIDPPLASPVLVTLRAVDSAPASGPDVIWTSDHVPLTLTRDRTHIVSVSVPTEVLPAGAVEVTVSEPGNDDPSSRVFAFIVRRDASPVTP